MLAIVGVEEHDARDVGPRRELLAQQRARTVAAAVVDEDHFVRQLQCVERRVKPREQRRKSRFLVEDRNDDGKRWRSHREAGTSLPAGSVRASARISAQAAQTRSTSSSVMPACSGSVTVESAIRSVFGRSPRW